MAVKSEKWFNQRNTTWVRLLAFSLVLSCGLFFAAASVSVELGWKPSPSPDVVAYKLYVGSSSGNYDSVITVGSVTNATLSALPQNTTYFVAVTAVDSENFESVPCSEISFTTLPPPNTAPAISIG